MHMQVPPAREPGPSARLWRAVRDAARRALDLVLPPRCIGCGTEVDGAGTLCPACWGRASFIGPPVCACCGRPFAFEAPGVAVCGACIAAPPSFDRARAVLSYDESSRGMILAFKHGDRTDAAGGFAAWMQRAGAELLADADLIAPVPLHRWRLWARRYNQAALLALALGRLTGVPAVPDLLVRRRSTPTQGGLSRAGRERNVAGAFALRPERTETAKGARILLVDDVFTTGATVSECARVLKRAGAARVDVLTLARVARPVAP